MALIVVVVAAVVGVLIWLNNRPLSLITVKAHVPVGANGSAWGPADAPVVITDWSDFQ